MPSFGPKKQSFLNSHFHCEHSRGVHALSNESAEERRGATVRRLKFTVMVSEISKGSTNGIIV